MTFGKVVSWLRVLLHNRSFQILVLQLLGTIGLIYLSEIWVKDPNVQLVVELGIAAFGFFAVSQTYLLTTNFHRYITHELLRELSSSQGRFITHVAIAKKFEKIHPGDEYVVEFHIQGKQLIQVSVPKVLTPVLRMEPALFQGDPESSDERFSVWRGQPIPYRLKEDGFWELKGQVKFNTFKINPGIEMGSIVALNLGFRGEDGLFFDLELGHVPVHLLTRHQVFRQLIELGALKKLPPGHHVLAVSPDFKFHTNLIFLAKRLHELRVEEEHSDQVRALEAAMARFIYEAFAEIVTQHPRLQLAKYEPQSYESEVNDSALLDNIIHVIASPRQVRPSGKVLVAIYQSREFIMQLEKERGFGICLFGFCPVAPSNVQVIFDLCQLKLNHDEAGNPCQVDWADLRQIAESSTEYFEKYAPQLIATLTDKHRDQRQQANKATREQGQLDNTLPMPEEPERMGGELEKVLSLVQPSADASLRHGCFVTSEPTITGYWINLGVFEKNLYQAGVQSALKAAIVNVIDRCAEVYKIDIEQLCILNLCSENSGIADELPTLWQFKHPRFPTYAIDIDRETKAVNLPYEITDINLPKHVILLAPFDSYFSTLETVLRFVRDRNNTVICIISLFSTAKTWDYLSASECFDIIPLFRINPKYLLPGLTPLTRMKDYMRLRPWLFQ